MKDLASAAYYRAAYFAPAAAEAYRAKATAASNSKNAQAIAAEIDTALAKPVEPEAPVDDVEEEPAEEETVAEPEQPAGNPMLLIVAGILVVAAAGGAFTVLKRRKS